MRHPRIITHGPRRPWLRPWRRICRCGLESSPCYVVQMRERQKRLQPSRLPWSESTHLPVMLGGVPLLTRGQADRTGGHGR